MNEKNEGKEENEGNEGNEMRSGSIPPNPSRE